MEPKIVVCPVCHKKLEVTNTKNEPVMLITCPNPECQAKMRVTFDTGETILASSKTSKNETGCLKCGRGSYPLRIGTNKVGRKSPTSEADIQIETDDHSMSRLHMEVEVVQLKSGRIKVIASDARKASLSEAKPIFHEDVPLENADKVVLVNGDVLTLGDTKVKYVV